MSTLGFDVAKDHVDVALINKAGQCRERWQVPNVAADIVGLLEAVMQRHRKLQAGCEATSYYHLSTVQACAQVQVPCNVLNPLLTKQFTRSTIRGRKTDRDDAVSIARLVQRGEGSLVILDRRLLARMYVRLATKAQQQKQSLELQERFYQATHDTLGIPAIDSPFAECLQALEDVVVTLRAQATQLVDDDTLKLLRSLPGIGPTVAVTLLAEIGSIDRFTGPKQLVAFVGLDPKVKQSGVVLARNTKLTKRGAPELRRVLFLAAHVARMHDPQLGAYYQKKRGEGRIYTVATVATARKLCYRIYAVLKRGTPYKKVGLT